MRANLSKISLRKKQIVTSLSPAKKGEKKDE